MFRESRRRFILSMLAMTGGAFATGLAVAMPFCATPEQGRQVREFYAKSPGTMPAIAARRLNLPEATVASALPVEQAASMPGKHFSEVWQAMTQWKEATFLIMKGSDVFEILSGIGKTERSKTSAYTNIEYVHPLRGHLRPDLYESIYAVALPGKDDAVARGVIFYGADGASVVGVFISGETSPPASELAKFDEVMKLVRTGTPVCAATAASPAK